jgi:hypothetical protein
MLSPDAAARPGLLLLGLDAPKWRCRLVLFSPVSFAKGGVVSNARHRQHARFAAAVISALAALSLAAAVPAEADPAGTRVAGQPSRAFTGLDMLQSVAATSASNAWAVGSYFVGSTSRQEPLIERWNGHAWKLAVSPAVGGSAGSYLLSVAAVSAKNAWAVGGLGTGKPLIEHWDGSAWRLAAAARIRVKYTSSTLLGVAASSATSVWAVGTLFTAHGLVPLIEHWNGKKWSQVASPDPGGLAASAYLTGVTASKAGAWAVGTSAPGNIYRTVVLTLARGKWRQLTSPNPNGVGNWLGGISAAGSHVLAAGFGGYDNPVVAQTLILHRSGPAFRLDATPNPGGPAAQDELYSVAATSAGGWAVGRSLAQTLILRERSGHWSGVPSPSWPSPDTSILQGVTTWRNAAWAVGHYSVDVNTAHGEISVTYSLIVRWTGRKWIRVVSPNR